MIGSGLDGVAMIAAITGDGGGGKSGCASGDGVDAGTGSARTR